MSIATPIADPPLLVSLPPSAHTALRRRARALGMSPTTLAHVLLTEALDAPRPAARTPVRVEEGPELPPLLGPLRALLAPDMATAEGWDDLQQRLAAHGYTLRERGGGLALYCTATAARICKASELGWAYADLIKRFRAPFPGHSHGHLADRVLGREGHHPPPGLFPDLEGDGEIILVEDE